MRSYWFFQDNNEFRCIGTSLVCTALLCLAACATAPPAPPVQPAKPAARQARPVDARAQQHFYDIGLQHYAGENYGEAKQAFQQVVELGPGTPLAAKAQENLRKIEKILKTLQEIESK